MNYYRAKQRAEVKLKKIIELEGTSNGERLKPYYFKTLIKEELNNKRFSDFTYKNALEQKNKCLA